MSKLAVTLDGGHGTGKVLAHLLERPDEGSPTSRTVVLEWGTTTEVDVSSGKLVVQVQLPSGGVLSDEKYVASGQDVAMKFAIKSSRHEWLHWQNVLSPERPESVLESFTPSWIKEVVVHIDGAAFPVPLDGTPVDRSGARYEIRSDDRGAMSLTIWQYRGARPSIELRTVDDQREIFVSPLPWLDNYGEPLPLQLLYERVDGESRVDVMIQDKEFSPVLAYYASGNRAAASAFSADIERLADRALHDKFQNPIRAAAGLFVLKRTGRKVPESWLANLAGIAAIPDGAILFATHLLERRDTRSDTKRVRQLLLDARSRGLPVFAECTRLMRDGLRRLSLVEKDAAVAEAHAWARDAVEASRPETIITCLAADDTTLSRIVPALVKAPSP